MQGSSSRLKLNKDQQTPGLGKHIGGVLHIKRHLGAITKRCIWWHSLLPKPTQAFYDIDDMVNDVVLHIVAQRHKYDSEKSREVTWIWNVTDNRCREILSKYRAAKRNALVIGIETLYRDLEESNPCNVDEDLERIETPAAEDIQASVEAVERVLQHGSERLRDFLDQIFQGTYYKKQQSLIELRKRIVSRNVALVQRVNERRKLGKLSKGEARILKGMHQRRFERTLYDIDRAINPWEIMQELRNLAETHAACFEDFLTVYRNAIV